MLRALALTLLGACSFQHGVLPTAGDGNADSGGSGSDAGGDALADSCVTGSEPLRACYTFDGDLLDRSSYANHATGAGATFGPGQAGQAVITSEFALDVGPSASLDLSTMTLKVSIRANTLPPGGQRYGLLDSSGRYRIFVQPGGAIRCTTSGGPDLTTVMGVVVIGSWARIACTYDLTTLRIYVNGVEVGSQPSSASIPTTAGGLVIGQNSPSGDNFDGAIDSLQIWNAIVAP